MAAKCALPLVAANFGIAMAARIPMMTTTISSSTSVKPRVVVETCGRDPGAEIRWEVRIVRSLNFFVVDDRSKAKPVLASAVCRMNRLRDKDLGAPISATIRRYRANRPVELRNRLFARVRRPAKRSGVTRVAPRSPFSCREPIVARRPDRRPAARTARPRAPFPAFTRAATVPRAPQSAAPRTPVRRAPGAASSLWRPRDASA